MEMAKSSTIYSVFCSYAKLLFLINELQVKQSGVTFHFQICTVDFRKSDDPGVKIGMTHFPLEMLAVNPMRFRHVYFSFIAGNTN